MLALVDLGTQHVTLQGHLPTGLRHYTFWACLKITSALNQTKLKRKKVKTKQNKKKQ